MTEPRRVYVVANPAAGHGRVGKYWSGRILPLIRKKFPDCEAALTGHPGAATKLTRDALKRGFSLILSLGGDGTLNEVVNGFFENNGPVNADAELGVLPFGSGGDFARGLYGGKVRYEKALETLIRAEALPTDVGRVVFADAAIAPRHFLNIADAGVVAEIMLHVNGMSRKWPALCRYLWGTCLGFLSYRNTRVRITFDGTRVRERDLTALVVANGRFFGRGMCPAPGARLDDGLFDIVILNATLGRFLKILPKLYRGEVPPSSPIHETGRCATVSIEVLEEEKKLNIEMDGENHGAGNATFAVLPGAIRLRRPPQNPSGSANQYR